MPWNPFKRKRHPDAHLFKSCEGLELADFEKYPAWIDSHIHDFGDPLYEDLDEETVRPWTDPYPVPPSASCQFKATLTTASGLTIPGVVTRWSKINAKENAMIDHAPIAFLPDGESVVFWHGAVYQFGDKWLNENKESLYRQLKVSPELIFPIAYSVSDDIVMGGIEGTIPGFGFFSDEDTVSFTA